MNNYHFAIAVVLLQLVPTGLLQAAEPRELDVIFTANFGPDSSRLEIAPDHWHVMRTHELAAQSGTSLIGATQANCHQTYEEEMPSGAWKNQGSCTWHDADGDQIFETYDGSGPDGLAMGVGTGRLVGGTGKFAGIAGALTWSCGEQCRKHGLY